MTTFLFNQEHQDFEDIEAMLLQGLTPLCSKCKEVLQLTFVKTPNGTRLHSVVCPKSSSHVSIITCHSVDSDIWARLKKHGHNKNST